MPQSYAVRFVHFAPRLSGKPLLRTWEAACLLYRTWQTRRALLTMTARELSDIGVSRATAVTEARRMPWETEPLPQWKDGAGR